MTSERRGIQSELEKPPPVSKVAAMAGKKDALRVARISKKIEDGGKEVVGRENQNCQ
jgi:hypothetical protein